MYESREPKATRRRWLRGAFAVSGLAALAALGRRAGAQDAPIRQPAEATPAAFIERAFALRQQAGADGDQPYGAVVVRDGRIVGEAPSRVVTGVDPTAHAETEALRDAARRLGARSLAGCILYSSSRPCPMCEAAAYWAGIERMVHGAQAEDAGAPRLRRC